jgi:hypothetical protein
MNRFERLSFAVLTLAFGLFLFRYQAARDADQRAEDRTNARAHAILETAAVGLREPLLGANYPMIHFTINSLVQESSDLVAASVQRWDGKVVVDAESEHVGTLPLRTMSVPIVENRSTSDEKQIGMIQVSLDVSELERARVANWRELVLEGGAWLLSAVLLGGWSISRRFNVSTTSLTRALASDLRAAEPRYT